MSNMQSQPLGSVAEFIRGITFKPNDVIQLDERDAVACLRTKNVQGSVDLSDVWAVPPDLVKREDQFLRAGDILVSSANSWNLVGKCCWIPQLPWRTTFGGFVSALRPSSGNVDPRYLYWWFSAPRTQALVRSFGQQTTNISNLNVRRCLELQVPLPAVPEQRRIADILDGADALRAKRREAIAKLEELPQAIFHEMFGSPIVNPNRFPEQRIGDLAVKFSDGPFGSNLKSEHYVTSGVRVIRLQNIGVGEFLSSDAAFISEDHFASLRKHECRPGDVLVGTLGDPNLRACIQPNDLPVALNKADCVQIRVDDRKAEAEWVCGLLNSRDTERLAHSLVLGQTRLRISMGRLRELFVPVPPLALQKLFAERIQSYRRLLHRQKQHEVSADELFASLQHRAFRGEL